MGRTRSIKAHLFFVFLFLFSLVIVLGFESLRSLSSVNDSSAQIRNRWLPSAYALGDLNNFTTDFPAAAIALLRAEGSSESSDALRQMADLDRGIAAAQLAYRRIGHDSAEEALYRVFEREWRDYRFLAEQGESAKPAYIAANNTLDVLTARTAARAREASERSDLAYSQARRRIATTILLAGLLVAGAMLYVTRSISAPLVHLAERMHRLAASETDIELHGADRPDEIGEMARAVLVFRDNAIDLAGNRQALAQQAATLQQKLAEEQRLTLLQRNFVSMASHEFRTPLALIDGHAQRLVSMRDRLTGDELVRRAGKIRSVVRRMTQLIDNLIGSARLIDGPLDVYFRPTHVDLAPLVREVCELQRELTPDALILDEVSGQSLDVHGDPSLLLQVVGNLLSNAVKYSPDGGLIRVTAMRREGQLAVTVEDCGIGIADGDKERIFEPYFRGSNTAGIVGSGVGLYLVRTIADLHQGSIALDSREGHGSRFTLRLPLRSGQPLPVRDLVL